MVMEEEPSPEYVGREFVRQYYTVLHACPENLHRFYSTESSFVHGGLEQPGESTRVAKGQAEIHKRIMSLNLRDCRAKIRQVDSFESVNGALVIQVIGELGNNGESMRRFVQTFVLVQQSPKSYYVNNDIFRYQDDVFRDEDSEGIQVKGALKQRPDEVVLNENESVFVHGQQDQVPTTGNESYANGSWSEGEEKKGTQIIPNAPVNPGFAQQQGQNPANVGLRGSQPDGQHPAPFDNQKQRQRERNAQQPTSPTVVANAPASQELGSPAAVPAPAPAKETVSTKTPEQPEATRATAAPAAPASSKPLTFAAVAGGGRSSPPSTGAAITRQGQGSASKANAKTNRDKSPEHGAVDAVSGNDEGEGHATEGQQHAAGAQAGGSGRGNIRSSYPNEQQVFVGNLPQDVSDEELQDFMTKFGGVMEVKICNKQPPGRQTQGRVTPAFAFVTFEHVDAVDKMLSALPINDFRGNLRLNIERKQEQRDRERVNFHGSGGAGSQGGGGQGYRSGGQFSGQSSGGQGGQASGRGGMRSGGAPRRFAGQPRGGSSYEKQ